MRRPILLGLILGSICAAVILGLAGGGPRAGQMHKAGPVLSDCDGTIRELVIHYLSAAKDIAAPVYRDFLRQLPAEVTVHVVCPAREDYDALVAAVGPVRCAFHPLIVSHDMTVWSRDRWLAMGPADGNVVTLVPPRGEEGVESWLARAGDQRTAVDIASALRDVAADRSGLYFDGGDFVADANTAFVSPRLLQRNVGITVRTRQELLETLGQRLKRRILLFDQAPDHHVGMYMMPAGGGVVLVGDPSAGRGLLSAEEAQRGPGPPLGLPPGPDFSDATQRQFDAVARQCALEGYRVVRIPVLPGKDGRTYITYVNVIIDCRDGRRTVYMPAYEGAEALNACAVRVWQSLGYEVCRIDCSSVYRHFGVLHCLVNVLRRSS